MLNLVNFNCCWIRQFLYLYERCRNLSTKYNYFSIVSSTSKHRPTGNFTTKSARAPAKKASRSEVLLEMDVTSALKQGLESSPRHLPVWYRYDKQGSIYNDRCLSDNKYYYFYSSEVAVLKEKCQVSLNKLHITGVWRYFFCGHWPLHLNKKDENRYETGQAYFSVFVFIFLNYHCFSPKKTIFVHTVVIFSCIMTYTFMFDDQM